MTQDHAALAKQVDTGVGALLRAHPEPMRAYVQMVKETVKAGALDSKTKELMAAAVAIVLRCEPCVAYHLRGAIRHGASKEEVLETISVAIEMGGGPAAVYGGKALAAYEELSK